MANLVYSVQRDDEGNAQFTPQQVVVSRGAVFSVQRNVSGAALFAQQYLEEVPPVTSIDLGAILSSSSVISIALQIDPDAFFAQLVSVGRLTSALDISDLVMVAQVKSEGTVSASMSVDQIELGAYLSSASSVTLNLQASETNLTVLLLASSRVTASLYFTSGSNIPRNAKLKAIPLDAESLQIVRYRGDTYSDGFVIYNDTTGHIIDITGCTFKMSLATSNKYSPFREIVYTLYGVVDNAEEGVVSFAPNVDQANRVGFYYYDVEMRDSQDVVRTLVSNSYVYKMDITP